MNARNRVGVALLTLWSGFNLLLALGIVVAVSFFGQPPPVVPLILDESAIAALDPRAHDLIWTMGVFLNSCAAGVSFMGLALVWLGVVRRVRWTFWVVAIGLGGVQIGGFLSDRFLDHANLVPNLVSTAVLLVGLALARTNERESKHAIA